MTQLERFAGGPAATPTLIQLRRKAGELPSQHFYNVVIYHGIKVGQAHKIGQLFIYGDIGEAFEQLAKEFLCILLVAPTLDENVQDVVVLIHRTPQVMAFTING
jgi:hypothetical protein